MWKEYRKFIFYSSDLPLHPFLVQVLFFSSAQHNGLLTFGLVRFLRNRRPAPPLSVGLDRDLLASPPDCLASRPRLSVQVLISQNQKHKKTVLMNGFFVLLVAGTGLEPAASGSEKWLILHQPHCTSSLKIQ